MRLIRSRLSTAAVRIGQLLEQQRLDAGEVEVIGNPPLIGELWGTSPYLKVAALAIEVVDRLTRNSRVLDLFGTPIPQFTMKDADAEEVYAPAEDDIDKIRDLINAGLERQVEVGTIRLSDSQDGLTFAQPNTQGVVHSLEQVQMLTTAIEQSFGLPQLDEAGESHSGEALKRMFVHFYAESRALQNAISRQLGIEWEHPFDTGYFAESVQDNDAGAMRMAVEMVERRNSDE